MDDKSNLNIINATTINVFENPKISGIAIKTEGYTSVDQYDLFTIVNANNVAESNYASFSKSRGTLDNPKPLQENDEIFSLFFGGWDTSVSPAWVAELTVGTEGIISPGVVPGYFAFKLMGQDGIANTCLTIHNDSVVEFNRDIIIEVGSAVGQADTSSVEKCIKVKVGDEYYAMPLFKIRK